MHYEIFVKGFKINKLNFQINEKPWKGWGVVLWRVVSSNMIIDIRCLKTQKYHIFRILQIHWIHVNAFISLIIFAQKFTTYYNINELGKNKVKSRILWLLITESFESISSEKTGPYVRAKQPSTVHLFHCIVDLECLHANCVYHSMGGSLVWFVCTLVWSNCKRAINVSITGTEMDKYLPNPPTYQTNPVPSQFIKQILPRYCETRIWELRNIWHERTFFLVRFCF